MKHTFLASTALVALTGFASAEVTISGTARIGLIVTEGAAAVAEKAAGTAYGAFTAGQIASLNQFGTKSGTAKTFVADKYTANTTAYAFTAITATAADITAIETMIGVAEGILSGASGDFRLTANITGTALDVVSTAALIDTQAERDQIAADIATMKTIRGLVAKSAKVAAVAKKDDTTTSGNRVRIAFAGSGETDGGMEYGFSARADHSNTSTGGSQYISGVFGKISTGDLNGADEQMVGDVAGVGFTGAGSNQEYAYQSSSHNLAYSISMSGVTFAASTDLVRGADSTKTGSNSAMGIKWSGDIGGTSVGIALGQSKIGTATDKSASISISTGGLTIKAQTHTDDNGAAVALGAGEVTQTFTGDFQKQYVAGAAAAANLDTDTTSLSVSYAMDGMSVSAFTRTEETSGKADKDYSGVGFVYSLGSGASLKAGFVDADNISIMDFGVNFSF
jgi:outer membrane protein OmpU